MCTNIRTVFRYTLQLNLTLHMQTLAHLTCAKLQKLVCAYTVAHNFGICMWTSEHIQHTRDVRTSRVCTWFATTHM